MDISNTFLICWGSLSPAANSAGTLVTFPCAYTTVVRVFSFCVSGIGGGALAKATLNDLASCYFGNRNYSGKYWGDLDHWMTIGY